MTQEDLGNILMVQKAAISKYENGRAEPSMDVLRKIATFFNVSIGYVMGEPEPAPAATKPPAPARTQRDQAMLDKYHTLTPSHRDAVDSVIDTFYLQDKPKTEDTGM